MIAPSSYKSFKYHAVEYDEEETNDRVIELIKSNELDAGIWLNYDKIFALDEINAAFDNVEKKQYIKAIVKLNDL